MTKPIYEFEATTLDGRTESLKQHEGKALLIVNVASKCGFTPQYKDLQSLYTKYKDQGFEVLGFPCNQFGAQEPGTPEEIKSFCSTNYGVTFPMYAKIDVNGKSAHPLYKHLTSAKPGVLGTEAVKWNFTKFLIGRDGEPLKRYAPKAAQAQLAPDIEAALS